MDNPMSIFIEKRMANVILMIRGIMRLNIDKIQPYD